ncbi:MAG: putative sulfate exporter family transporter [Muribaculaceae bacterium]|nr:putative sulfate exporter family transporter [Muribaculaceae bacterium]
MKDSIGRVLYWVLLIVVFFPFGAIGLPDFVTAPVGLALGLVFAIIFGTPFPKVNRVLSKTLLQASVVGLGFGMNLIASLQSGAEGMIFTVASVIGVMVIGVLLAKYMRINAKTGYLISAGTAICGGSAIAAVGPVVGADKDEMAVSLGVIFILNAIALFIFPPMGHFFGLSQNQFGTWAAIAIHDTSSVVGAGAAYGPQACDIATLIKCTRALWIIPLAFFTMWFFPKLNARKMAAEGKVPEGKAKVSIPWFIFYFVLAMIINTYTRSAWSVLPEVYDFIYALARKCLVAVLFAIGAGLSLKVIRSVGVKPLIQAVTLWVFIGAISLFVVMTTAA